jgi:hypothetical protein
LRICPECEARTDERVCPADGSRTVPRLAHTTGVDPLIGTVVADRYRVDAVLGGGGMGTVYRATQLSVDRPVALKLLRPEIARDLAAAARFQREARVIAGLTHPNTVDLIDFGQLEDDRLYLVMELVEGESLTDLIARSAPMPPARAGHLLRQILEPLAEAHAKGIVHRDLKPDNIIVARVPGKRDYLKLLDFGIARVDGQGEPAGPALTGEGIAIGSPRYMSPEQAQGLAAGPPSDVYAVGLLAWELLAGRPPFEATTARGWLLAHIAEPLPELSANGAPVPEPYRALVLRCLDKDPARRFDDAGAALQWLRQRGALTTGPQVAESPPEAVATGQAPMPDTDRRRRALAAEAGQPRPSRPRARVAQLAAVVAAVVAAVGAGWLVGARQRPDPPPGAAAPPAMTAAPTTPGLASAHPAERGSPARGAHVPEADRAVLPAASGRLAGAALARLAVGLPAELRVVDLSTEPSGATVRKDGVELGATPLRVAWSATDEPPALLIEAPDHAPARVRLLAADAGHPRHVVLSPAGRPERPTKPQAHRPTDYRRTGQDPYTIIR